MAKTNATAASMEHKPEESILSERPHAHHYPGRSLPKVEKVVEAQHNQAAHETGRKASLGVSKNGSHKGLDVAYEYVGHESGAREKDAPIGAVPGAKSITHNAAELAAARGNSMGVSADGSHKGLPSNSSK
jgi:hypothetical protein